MPVRDLLSGTVRRMPLPLESVSTLNVSVPVLIGAAVLLLLVVVLVAAIRKGRGSND